MIVVIGLLVSSFTLPIIGCPQPGSFVSTTVTPAAVTNTAVFPPPPLKMNRLSASFSTSTTFGWDCRAATADSMPAASRIVRRQVRVIGADINASLLLVTGYWLLVKPRAQDQQLQRFSIRCSTPIGTRARQPRRAASPRPRR